MRNYDLLDQTLAHIEAYPTEWDQSRFANECGTTFCFAGTAARIAHPNWYFEISSISGSTTGNMLDSRKDVVGRIKDVAAEALGLDDDDVDLFFTFGDDDAGTLKLLKAMIARWKRQDGVHA